MTPTKETFERWQRRWNEGRRHFAHCCADALSSGDLPSARRFAAKWKRCDRRLWELLQLRIETWWSWLR